MKITINRDNKTFAQNIEDEVIKKTKKFNLYFTPCYSCTAKEWDEVNKIKKQIRDQYDPNLRKITFNINF